MSTKVVSARRSRAAASVSSSARAVALDLRFLAVLGCFFVSGFAGLLYETAWTRQFAFVFGTSELAVVAVLAGYFGGLTFGAAVAGRWASRIRRPILTYGLLELGIALSALGLPTAIHASTRLYVLLFGGRVESLSTDGLTTACYYLCASFVILLVPTALMGATLPLLARYAVSEDRQIGPRIGLLYATNTIGAVAGTLTAAFILLPALGLTGTIWSGVLANVMVFLVAAWLSRTSAATSDTASPNSGVRSKSDNDDACAPDHSRLILPIMLISGAASFSYEVLWTRLLGHVLGASVFAFSTMLASFLGGIALGAAFGSRLAKTVSRSAQAFGIVQLLIAGASALSYSLLEQLPEWAYSIGAGAQAGLAANTTVCGIILFPGAFFIGATFPLAVRILARNESDAGPASARVYAWNTIGAIFGSVACGFVLLPRFQFGGTLVATASANLLLGAISASLVKPWRKSLVVCGAIGIVLLVLICPAEPWTLLRSSALGRRPAGGDITYYAVGRNTTVLLVDDGLGWDLRTSGLPEANIRRKDVPLGRVLIQQWQNALPVLARPRAKSMMFVGLGGGVAVESVPSSIERIDVVELEPEVVAANRVVSPLRQVDPLADLRVRLFSNDARNALLLSGDQYDVIVSQPSHPWTAGASHLYTREFMSMVRQRLAPDGVFLQWMSLAFVDEALLRSLVGTLCSVFPYVEMYAPYPGAVLFVTSAEPLKAWENVDAVLQSSPADFSHTGIVCKEDVLAALELDSDAAKRFAEDAAIISDDFNLLQLRAKREEGSVRSSWKITDASLAPTDPAVNSRSGLNATYLVRKLMTRTNSTRAMRVAESVTDPAMEAACIGHIRDWEGKQKAAIEQFESAARLTPNLTQAVFGLVRARSAELFRGEPSVIELARGLTGAAGAVISGWQLASTNQWYAVKDLDGQLASAAPTDDWFVDAARLRARWRIQLSDPASCRGAAEILNLFIPRFGSADDLLLLADAYVTSGNEIGALGALHEVALMVQPNGRWRPLAQKANEKLAKLRPELLATEAAKRARAMLSQAFGARP